MTAQDNHQANFDLQSRTRILAYELWEQAGKPDGRELEFWDRAKQILSEEAVLDGQSHAPPDVLAA